MVVLIPHHSRTDHLVRCLSAVRDWPVCVVDDSPSGVAPLPVPTVRTSGNTGFAAAINCGLAQLEAQGTRLVLILNDDAAVEPGCIDALVSAWTDADGALGPVLIDGEGRQTAGIRIGMAGRVRSNRGGGAGEVDALSGACLLIRATERLDPAYVHGFEDLDLCRRLHARSLAVRVVPDARCTHAGGATVGARSRPAQRAAIAGHLRYLGPGWRQGVAIALAACQVVAERGPVDRAWGILEGCRDHYWPRHSTGAPGASPLASSIRAEARASSSPGSSKTR